MASATTSPLLGRLTPPVGIRIDSFDFSVFQPSPSDEAPPGYLERAHSCDNCHANRINKCIPEGSTCHPCKLCDTNCTFNPTRKLRRSCLSCTETKEACMAGDFSRCLRCLTHDSKCFMRDYQAPMKANRTTKRKFLYYDPESDTSFEQAPQLESEAATPTPKRLRYLAALTVDNLAAIEPVFEDEAQLLSALEVEESLVATPSSRPSSRLFYIAISPSDYVSPYSPRPSVAALAYPTPEKTPSSFVTSSTRKPASEAPVLPTWPTSPLPLPSLPPFLETGYLQIASTLCDFFQPGFVYPEPYYLQPAYDFAPYAYPPVFRRE